MLNAVLFELMLNARTAPQRDATTLGDSFRIGRVWFEPAFALGCFSKVFILESQVEA